MFYFLCALVGLFCVIALGFGPLFFVLGGAALAVLAFRRRFQRWWGLPLAAAGAALVLSVALGWKWRHVVEAFAVAFVLAAVVRLAGRAFGRRGSPPLRLKHSIRTRVEEPPELSTRPGAGSADPGRPAQ